MQINIRAHHVDITPTIKEYVEKKLGKLDKYFDHIQEISVELDVLDVSDQNQRQKVAATVRVSGSVLRAQEFSIDIYASVDLVFAKLEKQLIKYKEKLRYRSRKSNKRSVESLFTRVRPEDGSQVTDKEKKLYIPKPMHPEDAASHLELEELDFFMFRNAATEEINVIYVMESGQLGLIEP